MKVIIPYKDFRGPELRYCLRGIEKYVKDPEVIIIGDRLHWLRNVEQIPFRDNPLTRYKARNIYEKIKGYENFLFFNDDHFLMKPFSPETYHYCGTIGDQLAKPHLTNSYRRTLENTFEVYGNIKNFDTHCPIYYKSLNFNLDWDVSDGYCIKSVYCYLNGIEGEEFPDLKIKSPILKEEIRELIEGRPYFSTGNFVINRPMTEILNELYPDKSIYE